jgi:FHS family glucose/mannose:H+ symporter-like MFS transporter
MEYPRIQYRVVQTVTATPPALTPTLPPTAAPRGLAGFFISGILLAFLGAVLPSWGYHLASNYQTVGGYFFSTSLGILAAAKLGHWIIGAHGIRTALVSACSTASAALLYLALVSPPAPAWARMIGVFFIGAAASLLHSAVFQAISPMYRTHPASTVSLAGTLFGSGCLTAALLFSGTFYVYTVPSVLTLLAVAPAFFAAFYARSHFGPVSEEERRPVRDVLNEARSPAALLLAFLLFFQFGNEWAIAGWLPLLLIQRLGISPEKSLLLLGLYWLSLLVGRIVSQGVLPNVSHARLLMGSVVAAMFGCLILTFTDNRLGAMVSTLLLGAGFAPIYPLVVEKIGDRFPDYHPGLYNGIFSFALIGGLLAPCSLGWFADIWSIRAVAVLPLFGTLMVLVLLIAIWLEGRATGA